MVLLRPHPMYRPRDFEQGTVGYVIEPADAPSGLQRLEHVLIDDQDVLVQRIDAPRWHVDRDQLVP